MKLARYSHPDGTERFGPYSDGRMEDMAASSEDFAEAVRILSTAPRGKAKYPSFKVDSARLMAPVSSRSKVLCLALNYRSHINEMNAEPTAVPIIFPKYYSSLTGPYQTIPAPEISPILDYEGEVAVVIGKVASRVEAGDAWDHIYGYTLLNDVSARSLFRVPQGKQTMLDWFSCKALDRLTPVGPWVVSADEVGEFSRLRIETYLNGSKVQSESVSDMVFDVPQLIEFISSRVTLNPGDIISTGTPSGVGVGRKRTLKAGDVVRVQVERIGHLENKIA